MIRCQQCGWESEDGEVKWNGYEEVRGSRSAWGTVVLDDDLDEADCPEIEDYDSVDVHEWLDTSTESVECPGCGKYGHASDVFEFVDEEEEDEDEVKPPYVRMERGLPDGVRYAAVGGRVSVDKKGAVLFDWATNPDILIKVAQSKSTITFVYDHETGVVVWRHPEATNEAIEEYREFLKKETGRYWVVGNSRRVYAKEATFDEAKGSLLVGAHDCTKGWVWDSHTHEVVFRRHAEEESVNAWRRQCGVAPEDDVMAPEDDGAEIDAMLRSM